MNAESDRIRQALVDRLSTFEEGLDSRLDDARLIADVQDAIARLLEDSGSSEAQIRRILQDRYDGGHLRKETFQLVKSMLDGFGARTVVPESPKVTVTAVPPRPARGPVEPEPDPMTSTLVLPTDTVNLRPDSAEDAVQVGSLLRDRFLLQERVAGGGMGVIYKALDRRLAESGSSSSWVAVKVLSPQLSANGHALRALQQEAAKGRCLAHPNIVRFLDLDRDDDLYFIVMEWLEGRTLADILDSPDAKGIDRDRAFQIARQIGKALDYAHRCGIVHADVKPANIMIMPNGAAKLFDFGVARVRQKTLAQQADFDPGVLGLLTPAYSSMQVLTGEEPTPADDVFSLACLLYRLLAGYRVFGPRNAAEAAEEGMTPQRLDALNDAQWRVLKKALSFSRVTRFESMADFIDALDVETAEPITITVPAREDPEVTDETRGAGRWLAAVVVIAGLAAVAEWQFGVSGFIRESVRAPVESPLAAGQAGAAPLEAAQLPAGGAPAEAGETSVDGPGPELTEVAPGTGAPTSATAATNELPGPPAPEIAEETSTQDLGDAENPPPPAIEAPAEIAKPLVDFAALPAADAELRLATNGGIAAPVTVRLRENGAPATVDLVRDDVEFALTLRVEEVGFSGNRSPWVTGQYAFSENGFIQFPAGQERARVTLTMTPDPVREADQQSTLKLRESDSAGSQLGIINVVLEDDDQRAFEAALPADTVGFASSQVSVREQDPAVQIDILRFNPGNEPLSVNYTIRDITATQGEDYFLPGTNVIEFGPGQRSARLLIPLVQDSVYERNEAFSVELQSDVELPGTDVYLRTAVMIRDDDN
jgi:hypothetical protein